MASSSATGTCAPAASVSVSVSVSTAVSNPILTNPSMMIETTVAACDPVKGGATTATTTTVATGAGATATDVKSMPAEAEPDINAAIISNNDVSDDATERYSAHIKSAQRQRTSRGAGELLTWVQCDTCEKWRSLSSDHARGLVPDALWHCREHPVPDWASCNVPEESFAGEMQVGGITSGRQLSSLPNDVLAHIFTFLGLADRLQAACVCHRWRTVCNSARDLWQRLVLSRDNDLITNWAGMVACLRAHGTKLVDLRGLVLAPGAAAANPAAAAAAAAAAAQASATSAAAVAAMQSGGDGQGGSSGGVGIGSRGGGGGHIAGDGSNGLYFSGGGDGSGGGGGGSRGFTPTPLAPLPPLEHIIGPVDFGIVAQAIARNQPRLLSLSVGAGDSVRRTVRAESATATAAADDGTSSYHTSAGSATAGDDMGPFERFFNSLGRGGSNKTLESLRLRTTVELPAFSFRNSFNYLRSFTRLRTLEIYSERGSSFNYEFLQPLRALETLSIGSSTEWDTDFFETLSRMPRLRNLRLVYGGLRDDTMYQTELHSHHFFQLRALERLHLVWVPRPGAWLGAALSSLPNLRELELWLPSSLSQQCEPELAVNLCALAEAAPASLQRFCLRSAWGTRADEQRLRRAIAPAFATAGQTGVDVDICRIVPYGHLKAPFVEEALSKWHVPDARKYFSVTSCNQDYQFTNPYVVRCSVRSGVSGQHKVLHGCIVPLPGFHSGVDSFFRLDDGLVVI